MRAALFRGVGTPLSIDTVPDPVPAPGQVVLEISHTGICGSDLHWTQTEGIMEPGIILGHEFAGTIVDANGTGHKVGTRVTALPIFPCWKCSECEGDHVFHCTASPKILGYTCDGAFARAVAADGKLVQTIPAGVDFREAAMIEPLAVGYRTISHARNLKGAKVLVMGAGPIGSAVNMFAGLLGAEKVIVSDPSAGRRKMALALGATAAIDPRAEDVRARFIALCGAPPDIVVECVGIPGVIAEAIRLVRSRGQVISAGDCYTPDTFVPIDALTKELAVNFSCSYEVTDFEAVINALAREGINPEPMITDMITLDQLPVAFEALRQPQNQCKVLVAIN